MCDKKIIKKQIIKNELREPIENEHYYWVVNYFPKFEGHTMVIPKRHLISLADESKKEVLSRNQIEKFAVKTLKKLYPKAGVEIFLQYGSGSASSIPHLHWHIVPALPGDNLRSFEKLGHFYTREKDKEKIIFFPIKIKKAKKILQQALSKIIKNNLTAI